MESTLQERQQQSANISLEQARANLQTVFAQLEQAFPTDNKGRSAGAVPLLDARLNPGGQGGAQVVQISMILMTIVGIVLLIACANIANLLLARANKRRKEIAIRLALVTSPCRCASTMPRLTPRLIPKSSAFTMS